MDGLVSLDRRGKDWPVAVIGAGPVGLAAAAHLLARGLTPVVLEASGDVGASFRDYAHVRLFSPWRYNIDGAARALLERRGWTAPDPAGLPTGGEVHADYLKPLAATPEIAAVLRLEHRVIAIARAGFDKVKTVGRDAAPFALRVERADGAVEEILASAVIDASGTWSQPNPLGADGLPALGEAEHAARIRRGIPDALGSERARYAGKRVLVVGAGHSAANALIDLAALATDAPGTRIVWAIRGEGDVARLYGGGEADALAARGALGSGLRRLAESGGLELRTGFKLATIRRGLDGLDVHGHDGTKIAGIDEIVCATGQRPNLDIARELRLRLDPALECAEALGPLIDPNLHSCGTVRPHGARELAHPETGFFVAGVKSYGRAPTFLLATGYEQVRSIAAALAGDWVSAARVELDLPETGVCSAAPASPGAAASCGPATDGAGSCGARPPTIATKAAAACCGPTPASAEICCEPAAKQEAIAAAASCCGPAAKAGSLAPREPAMATTGPAPAPTGKAVAGGCRG